MAPQKYVVIGAGPVGAMAAMYAAERGHDVEVYELRNDLRDSSTIPLNFTKSINLSLSERGINAIKKSGRLDLLDKVMQETTPVRGRMIHGRSKSGTLFEEAQDYDIHGRTNYACDRGALNAVLLDALQAMPNVKLFFNHKLVGADFKSKKAWLEVKTPSSTSELEITFDLMIGADGAHSATRYHLMKYTRMDYKQEYIDTLWCEFRIEPALENGSGREEGGKSDEETFKAKFKMSPNHLHIWPGKDHMFIAIPSQDGSFTCTLFMPSAAYTSLSQNPSNLVPFFDTNFPGVTTLIAPTSLQHSFAANPHLPLISITCTPYHYTSTAVILGDAAHAMVPFYGQGMNAGLESVYTLFSILDSHLPSHIPVPSTPTAMAEARAKALAEYSNVRAPDAAAIEKLALDNYLEMRSSVTSPLYKLRKNVEEFLSINFPGLGVVTKYSLVSFGNIRYSEVVKSSDRQGQIIRWAMMGVMLMPLAGVAFWALWRWRSFTDTTRWTIRKQAGLGWSQRGWL